MKRTAFIQALIIFILLVGSWALLLMRFSSEEDSKPEGQETTGSELRLEPEKDPESPGRELESSKPDARPASSTELVPEEWNAWVSTLSGAQSRNEMRMYIADLRAAIFSMPESEASSMIKAFLESGVDMRTGLAFQLGTDGELLGAGSLRAILLDWLLLIDPAEAALLAREELTAKGTSLTPDEYAIHMRNYARATADSETEAERFLKVNVAEMLNHQPWIQNPVSAVAEAFDVAVYTEATEFVPRFSELMEINQPQILREAAATTIEHLVDRAPQQSLTALLSTTEKKTPMFRARAGYFARLDPANAGSAAILDAYLSAPGVTNEEIEFFLLSFPNLNETYSNSLLSNHISITKETDYIDRFQSAIESVRQWKGDPGMAVFGETLDTIEARLEQQIQQIPGP